VKQFHLLLLTGIYIAFSGYSFAEDVSASDKSVKPTKFGELTGTFALATDYMFRGVSLSNNLPAVQGGLTYTILKPGIYFNLWSSSTDVPVPQFNERATIEIDTAIGITNNFTDNFSYNVNLLRYNYPKATSLEYNELITKWAYEISAVTLTAEIDYSNNVFNSSKSGTYYNGRIDIAIPEKYLFCINAVTASGSFGHYSLPRSAGLNSYNDYFLGIAKEISIYTLALQWTGTNGQYHAGTLDDNRFVGIVTASF
jgi:uncharacterized protein (TIGR02001 family)